MSTYAPQTAVSNYREDTLRRQLRFVQEYVIDLNGQNAAIRAGYSPKGADVAACRLLADVRVGSLVAKEQARIAEKAGLKAEAVIGQAARNAFYDVRDAFDEDGHMIPIPDMPECIAAAIQGVEVTRAMESARDSDGEMIQVPRITTKIKFADRGRAIDTLMKHLGLYAKDNDQKSKPVQDLMAFLESQNNRLRAVTLDAESIEVLQPGDDVARLG